ncbi:MAG: FHA domain-containing protein [Deltaproteobacteria bacterium]|nr:FHA domain-containing protein [Deltaproteobacteria bacterium]
MQMEALHSTFSGLVGKYAQHREYIRRAQAQAHKFTSGVVQKVILDHEIQASKVADELLPLVPSLEDTIDDLAAQQRQITADKAASDERFQELELRLAIAELPEDEFELAAADLRAELDGANSRLAALEADRERFSSLLTQWVSLAGEGGQRDGTRGTAGAEASAAPAVVDASAEPAAVEELVSAAITTPQPNEEAEEDVSFDEEPEQAAATPAAEELSAEEPEPVVSEDDGRYSSTGAFTEDVSAVYGGQSEAPASEESEPLEAADAAFDVGFEEEPSRPAPPVVDDSQDEIGIDLDVAEEPAAPAPVADEGRRALLLYQEGTAEEQIYPFTGEVLTIGRGRDNDIQIKNDSKVSRFHCKLFRRNGSFYIEDNKSSNGTLVNGELITERRLFGGEEVIIGETYFRFRIM